jgi:hypothetical protein
MKNAELLTTLPIIRLNDRIAIFGRTGTGKSILAHSLFRSIPIPQSEKQAEERPFWRLCIDVTDSIFDDALTFFDSSQIPWGQSFSLRFVPDVSDLVRSIDDLYTQVMLHGDCWVWLDEANEISTSHSTVPGLRRVLLQGRKFQIGHCAVTPRPVDISRSIITQSEHLFVFPLTDPKDRARVAENVNLLPDDFDMRMSSLENYGYLWYSVRDDSLFEMPPLPEQEVLTLE